MSQDVSSIQRALDDCPSPAEPQTMECDIGDAASGRATRSSDINASEAVKEIVVAGLGFIPHVGGILAPLVGFLWPSSAPSLWDQIREEVETLIDQKINDAVYSLLSAKLAGLGDASALYISLLERGATGDVIRTQWVATNTVYVAAAPEFMNKDFQWTVGPLFSIFAVLHMSLLRDAVLYGPEWGWTQQEHGVYSQLAETTLNKYLAYFDQVVTNQENALKSRAPKTLTKHRTNIYNWWQAFRMQSIVAYDDYRVLVEYLDASQHPSPTSDIPFKDVFTPAYGTADDWTWEYNEGVSIFYSAPLRSFSQIYMEMFNRGPRKVNVTYNVGDGPLVRGSYRVDGYGILMKDKDGVEKKTVKFADPVPDKAFNITSAYVRVGSIPMWLSLFMDDGEEVVLWDKDRPRESALVEVEGRKLSTLNMWTLSKFYNYNLGCIIFGFSKDPIEVKATTLETLYVCSVGDLPDVLKAKIKKHDLAKLEKARGGYWKDLKRSLSARAASPRE